MWVAGDKVAKEGKYKINKSGKNEEKKCLVKTFLKKL